MITNDGNTEGLFRGAIMESGAPISVGDIENGQIYYDQIVRDTGCSGSTDTLQCLREVEFNILKAAIDATPGIFDFQVCICEEAMEKFRMIMITRRYTLPGCRELMAFS